jgi:hypothetical protein
VKLTTHLHLVPKSKNVWSYTSIPQYAFMVWCLVKHKDFTFTFDHKVERYDWMIRMSQDFSLRLQGTHKDVRNHPYHTQGTKLRSQCSRCQRSCAYLFLRCTDFSITSRNETKGSYLGRGSILCKGRNFSSRKDIQTNSANRSASNPMERGSGVKRPERDVDTHLHIMPGSRMHGALSPRPHIPS